MGVINAYDKDNYQCSGSIVGGCEKPLIKKSISTALKFLGNTIKFIESWMNTTENNYIFQ